MISSAIFARYARALADVAIENRQEPQVTTDLAAYRNIFQTAPHLLDVFHSPAIPRESKEGVLDELLARLPVCPITGNFLKVILQHNRMRCFHEILDHYTKIVNNRKGVVSAQVTAAAPLSDQDLASLRVSLATVTGSTVTLDVRTDPELLGGLVVQIGSTIYDGSIRRQLAEMRRRLAEA